MADPTILSDENAVESIKEKSRSKYVKAWEAFKKYNEAVDFEICMPEEETFLNYFKHLRSDLQYSSSTIWTIYSMINSVCKGKYGKCLQKYPRITSLLKSFSDDVVKKAAIFSQGDVDDFVRSQLITSPYWLVRKVFFFNLRCFICHCFITIARKYGAISQPN